MRFSCRRLPCSDLDKALISSGVTSATESCSEGGDWGRLCWGSISWTVDLKRTVGPVLSALLLLLWAIVGLPACSGVLSGMSRTAAESARFKLENGQGLVTVLEVYAM